MVLFDKTKFLSKSFIEFVGFIWDQNELHMLSFLIIKIRNYSQVENLIDVEVFLQSRDCSAKTIELLPVTPFEILDCLEEVPIVD